MQLAATTPCTTMHALVGVMPLWVSRASPPWITARLWDPMNTEGSQELTKAMGNTSRVRAWVFPAELNLMLRLLSLRQCFQSYLQPPWVGVQGAKRGWGPLPWPSLCYQCNQWLEGSCHACSSLCRYGQVSNAAGNPFCCKQPLLAGLPTAPIALVS